MDNQQRSLELRLAWLGGIIDGEGTISFASKFSHSSRQNNYHFRPYVSITNSDMTMVEEIKSILDEIGCGYYIRSAGNPSKRKENWKEYTQVYAEGMRRLHRLLPILIPYLVSKRRQAEAVLQYIESRFTGEHKEPVRDDQLQLVLRVKQLNHRGVLNRPETVRRTPKGDDTVRPPVRAGEADGNDQLAA